MYKKHKVIIEHCYLSLGIQYLQTRKQFYIKVCQA